MWLPGFFSWHAPLWTVALVVSPRLGLQQTTRLRATTLHMRGNVLLLYGSSYISSPICMTQSSLCIPTTSLSSGWWPMTSLLVSYLVRRLYFRSMSSRLFINLILHIKTRIPCREDPSLPLKIFQKSNKTSTKFQQYMYLMCLIVLHYYNVTWLNIPLWIYGKTWTLWSFFNMGNTFLKLHQVFEIAYNSDPNTTHGMTITSSDVDHKAKKWFFHHMNGPVLFKMYTWSLDTLELSVIITFLLFITIGEVCMLKSDTSLLGVNNVIEWKLPSLLDNLRFFHFLFRAYFIIGHVI